jgi:predicted DCC family thiol-disulfide oxidoreductase YuxK
MRAYSYRDDPAVPSFPDDKPIIIFDGDCVICSKFARFVIEHDREGKLRLLPAQTPLGSALYRHYGLDPVNYETNVLIENGLAHFKSHGSLRMVERFGFPWSLARLGRVVPAPILDRLYAFIARNRFNWFGRRDTCLLSLAGYEDRFLG